MFVFLGMTEALFKKPVSSLLLTVLAGMLVGIFCPTLWILGVGVLVLSILVVIPLLLFLATMSNSSSGLGPMIFVASIIFGLIFLVSMGGSYYLATGQTGIQDLFASLRTLTN